MEQASKREIEGLRRLREVLRLVTEERDTGRLLPLILEQAVELVGAERGFVVRCGLAGATPFEVAASRNLDREDIQDPQFKVSRSIVERVATKGASVLVHDAMRDLETRDVPSILALRVVSLVCVPLRVHGNTLGVIYLDHRHVKKRFFEQDLATLEAFAVPAASALDAVLRTAELERRGEEVRRSRDELGRQVSVIERLRTELADRYRERSRELNRVRGLAAAKETLDEDPIVPGVVARSPAMKRVLALLTKAAASDAPVLVLGESGVGKESLARAVHAMSTRAKGPFVAESCAALADPLLESELFGHEAGAFTGAVKKRAGLFELARSGTLFLDEVGEMSPALQAKLLRVLQEKEVRPVGAGDRVAIDARIVAATHRDIEQMVARGTFRADLYYRLNVVRLEVPPLRERPEDAAALLDLFVGRHAPGLVLEPQTRELLLAHDWPGNVRELENEVRRLAVAVGKGGVARPGLLSAAIVGRSAPSPVPPGHVKGESSPIDGVWRLDDLEKAMIERALEKTRGRKEPAARLLGLTKGSLYRRLKKHGFPVGPGDEGAEDEDE